jgi:hypothetical protein
MGTGGRFTVMTAAAALALAVIGTDAAAVESTVPDAAGGGIPEGLYRTPELTRDDLLAAGSTPGSPKRT